MLDDTRPGMCFGDRFLKTRKEALKAKMVALDKPGRESSAKGASLAAFVVVVEN